MAYVNDTHRHGKAASHAGKCTLAHFFVKKPLDVASGRPKCMGMLFRLLILLQMMFVAPALAQSAQPQTFAQQEHTRIELVAEQSSVAAGKPLTIAVVMTPQPGWHTYWQNPGDSGSATRLNWKLPEGWSASAPAYPTPKRFTVAQLVSYVYDKPSRLLVTLTAPSIPQGATEVPIALQADWLVCDDEICVPEAAALALTLPVGDGANDPARTALFSDARAQLPKAAQASAKFFQDADMFQLEMLESDQPDGLKLAGMTSAYFYPVEDGVLAYGKPQTIEQVSPDKWVLSTGGGYAEQKLTQITGILAVAGSDGAVQGWLLSAERTPKPLRAAVALPAAGPQNGSDVPPPRSGLLALLGFALLGGLILNVMPCVFPILSLKALSLAKAGAHEAHARAEAAAYTAGVLATFGLAGIVLAWLRASGFSVGWGVHLQDPRSVAVLALVMVVIGLNLLGAFEIGGGLSGVGQDLTQKRGWAGAFWTGALAVLVASPCTVPFMGAALGATLVLPPAEGLLLFLGVGFGMALPYLLIAFVPALRRMLPRPGAWMESFRRFMAFPMFATAVWLSWVVGRQAGIDGMALVLVAALLVSLALWLYGRGARGVLRPVAAVVSVAAAVLAVAVLNAPDVQAEADGDAKLAAQAFTDARLSQLLGEGKPTFVYFTADWCVTCKVNEKLALNTAEVANAFAQAHVTVLEGDWTRQNPEIAKVLARYGRNGVPLYLYFPPGSDIARPQILPQVLTPQILTELVTAPVDGTAGPA